MGIDGNLLEEGDVSTENLLHTQIYKNFEEIRAVIHTHTTYTNAFFLENTIFTPRIFESKVFLGEVKSVEQSTPAVTDAGPVIRSLKNKNITVLRNHGVVAMGKELFDCFLLVQALEEAIKVIEISRSFKKEEKLGSESGTQRAATRQKKYKLFSEEQINEIVRLVNEDKQMKKLGEQTKMTMELAVKLDETNQIYSFSFKDGKIVKVGKNEDAEFLTSASEDVWRAIFNREIDPFVATTQKKMNLRGDFAKLSKWYAPCNRVFELWQRVPVE
jgi:ribulose-5-phosphate 4-epimerase/fuculose-1-phosphate aldolase